MSEEKGVWRTVAGRKIFIADGQSLTDAMRASGKFSKDDIAAAGGSKGGGSKKTNADSSDKTSIKEQVKASQSEIAATRVLVKIPKGKMITDFQTAATTLRARLSKNGGVVERKDIGKVQVGSRLKQAGAYITKPAEIAALSAVPAVIERGKIIATHKNHKGREYETCTIAGKVEIDGEECVVAVVVTKTTGQFYKLHRVLTADGKTMHIKKGTD